MKRFLSLLLALMMVLSLVACGSNGADAGSEDDANDIVEDTADDTSDEANAEEKELNWWVYNHESWGEQKENPELVLFDGAFTAPIDLRTINDFAKEITYFPGGVNGRIISDINEALDSDVPVDDTVIWVYFGEVYTNSAGYTNYTKSFSIDFSNESDADGEIPMKDMVNNNWWSIADLYFPDEALGIYMEDEDWGKYDTIEDIYSKDEILLEKIVEKLGCPTHIYSGFEIHWDDADSVDFELLYEYPDFTICINVQEIKTYGEYTRKIGYVKYVPDGDYAARVREEMESAWDTFKIIK